MDSSSIRNILSLDGQGELLLQQVIQDKRKYCHFVTTDKREDFQTKWEVIDS